MRTKFSICFFSILLLLIYHGSILNAQSSIDIYKDLQKFNFLGKILYVAAHPDDENTAVISYFSNFRNAEIAYLSLTRGGGGQNLIGPELQDELGLIRTYELMEARKIDGGKQFFSTAIDFGYSKSSKETFSIWGKDLLLKQTLDVINDFRPDIIINRFDHQRGRTHGHHTAASLLSIEAFDILANDSLGIYKDYWKPKRLFHNTSWWFYGSRENFENAMKQKNVIPLEVSLYDPITGLTNSEIAALSRSQHKSQGFGSSPSYGLRTEYFELIRGDAPTNDVFDDVDTSWNRINGGKPIAQLMKQILDQYSFKSPYESVPDLLKVYDLILQLKDQQLKSEKSHQLKAIIKAAIGLELQYNTSKPFGIPNEQLNIALMATNLGSLSVQLNSIEFGQTKLEINQVLKKNNPFNTRHTIHLDNDLTTPFWLLEKKEKAHYLVKDPSIQYLPDTPKKINALFSFEIGNTIIEFEESLKFRNNDPVEGQVVEYFQVVPPATFGFDQSSYLFKNDQAQQINVQVTAHGPNFQGNLSIATPEGWHVTPKTHQVSIEQVGQTKNFSFSVNPPKGDTSDSFQAIIQSDDGKKLHHQMTIIDYPHISRHYKVHPSVTRATHLDFKTTVKTVGYINGAGDEIPSSLRSIGIEVNQYDIDQVQLSDIEKYKTLIIGIRAFNVEESIAQKSSLLWEYARKGGTLIIQYNTSRNLQVSQMTPLHLQLSRLRVTDEHSPIRFLDVSHPVLNHPNKITQADFKQWIQERGLYFASDWDDRFQPILSMNDPEEQPLEGSLLIADYHQGKIIYTGISFFRQLPYGIAGAYRLFANLISLGHE